MWPGVEPGEPEVMRHLAPPNRVRPGIRVEITAETREGFPEDKVRVVTENARTLKFHEAAFEDE